MPNVCYPNQHYFILNIQHILIYEMYTQTHTHTLIEWEIKIVCLLMGFQFDEMN